MIWMISTFRERAFVNFELMSCELNMNAIAALCEVPTIISKNLYQVPGSSTSFSNEVR